MTVRGECVNHLAAVRCRKRAHRGCQLQTAQQEETLYAGKLRKLEQEMATVYGNRCTATSPCLSSCIINICLAAECSYNACTD